MARSAEKSKLTNRELLDDSQHIKNGPKSKKQPKRQQKASEEEADDEDFGQLIGQYNATVKKRKPSEGLHFKDTKHMLLETMGQQMLTRKQGNEEILSSLSSLVENIEADFNVMSENEQKLQHMAATVLKSAQQTTNAAKENIKILKCIQAKFKNQCEVLESDEKAVNNKMADELEDYMNKLQQKLVNDTKKKQLDNLRKSLFQAMNDI